MYLFRTVMLVMGVCCVLTRTDTVAQSSWPQSDLASKDRIGKEGSFQENWEVFYIHGSKVGYGHTTARFFDEDGKTLVEWVTNSELTMKRFGQTVTQSLKLISIESPRGQLVRFQNELVQATVPVSVQGRVQGNRLTIQTSSSGKQQATEIPWKPDWLGFYATEQSLINDPLRPGQTRQFKALMPVFNQVATIDLEAVQYEPTKLLAGVVKLLRVRSTTDFSGQAKIESVLWVDCLGQTLKTHVPAFGQVGYRTNKQIALAESGEVGFDLGHFSTVRLNRPLNHPHQTKQIVYRVVLKDDDPSSVFVTGVSQTVAAIDPRSARITVRAIRPETAHFAVGHLLKPTEEDRLANSLIQSDDPRIVQMAKSVAADMSDPWSIARQLEQYVRDQIQVKDFSQVFATAAEVAQTLEGDCTEHAVLLAALCRARDIPARVAMGLVYYRQAEGFAYHMWNEVWIKDRWIPLDATLALGGIGAAHLKLADSNLHGATAYTAFLPVLQVMGRLEIEIERVD